MRNGRARHAGRSGWGIGSASAALAGILLLAAGSGAAEVYRCPKPGGGVTYSDDPSACPGAEPHPAEDRIQRVDPGASAPVAPRAARSPQVAGSEATDAAEWRARKRRAEEGLEDVARQRKDLEQYLTHCNHGRKLFTETESGLKRTVSCDEVRSEYSQLAAREQELRHYLDEELEEQCRQAGCLPGWLR